MNNGCNNCDDSHNKEQSKCRIKQIIRVKYHCDPSLESYKQSYHKSKDKGDRTDVYVSF